MKVFVSYKRNDNDSETLLSLLKADLARVFVSVCSDRLLTAGVEWRPDLLKMIDRCDIFVVLLSEKAVESEEVSEEVRRAYDSWSAAREKSRSSSRFASTTPAPSNDSGAILMTFRN
ncbi:MAG: hypothetical protein QOI58_1147 [Thermoanaerobaculia bacterium]|jgi:hypothetical protein|nr:hypothetical protein [Thermoanaerobaculia bacterium]